MLDTFFECGTLNCTYAIASRGMNAVQLKALRNWSKSCPRCGKITKWLEQLPLLNTKTLSNLNLGGSNNESLTIKPITKTASQKRKADRAA